ncbi:hypothetical protein [Agrobacterium tumefaciens]|uniref:hypothetical protein n=1 Tax=Agrobacterium tumefaciens TaxID=358 RepID=UPI003B9DD9C8
MTPNTGNRDMVSASKERDPGTLVLADGLERAGPAFFARHAVAELQTWSEQELSNLGQLPFPMAREQPDRHFHSLGWGSVLIALCDALSAGARSVLVVTARRWANEASGIASTLRRLTPAAVEEMQAETWPPRPSSLWNAARQPLAEARIVLVLGEVDASAWCFDSRPSLLVHMCERMSGSMLWPAEASLVFPITGIGWKASPHMFRRMLDFESEQSTAPNYSQVLSLTPPLSRPLCSVIAEIATRLHSARADFRENAKS